MSIKKDGYFYNKQIKTYILQFMAIFTGLQVMIGKLNTSNETLIDVPIHYGYKDRIVAAILADNTQNTPIRLPTMSAFVKDIQLSEKRFKGVGMERRTAYVPVGGLIPDDIKVVHQRMPVPYDLTMELAIYASNSDQMFQILEQLMPLFDPLLQIQLSDAPFDWTKITTVKLTNTAIENNYPIGIDRRIIQTTLTFEMPIYIETPADVHRDFIEQIYYRIGLIKSSDQITDDVLSEFDSQHLPYQQLASDDELPFS
jgi:hypothetical protein